MNLAEIEIREPLPGHPGKFVHGPGTDRTFGAVYKEAVAPVHQHPHEQIMKGVAGSFGSGPKGEITLYGPGDRAIVTAIAPNGSKTRTPYTFMDIFCPAREKHP